MGSFDHVEILLAVRNGERHLREQLESIAAQTHRNWSILVGDDGSTDNSQEIVRQFARQAGKERVRLIPGSQSGMAANFFTLLSAISPGSVVAFCDQDDVWMPHKLSRGLDGIDAAGKQMVAYCSRTVLTDENLRPKGLSPLPLRGPSFGNALVQNILAGNTLLLSPAAAAMMQATVASAIRTQVPFHDWWTYQMMAGIGAGIIVDPEPGLYYRQHARNEQGSSRGIRARAVRGRRVLHRDYARWLDSNLTALQSQKEWLLPENAQILEAFAAMRKAQACRRVRNLSSLGISRQTNRGTLAIYAMALTGML